MRKPDFFIVGAPKCGTTAMYTYLKQHPEIFMPDYKEPHFFCTDLHAPWYEKNEQNYLSLFSSATTEKRIGEASVWYLFSKQAAVNIKKFCPSARIIIMLRNPVDMLYSLHSQFLYSGNEDRTNFKEALDTEPLRKAGKCLPNTQYPIEFLFYREVIKYSEQVRRYFTCFGKRQVHIILFEEFKFHTQKVYRETLRFLEVNENYLPAFQIVNANKRTRSKTLRKILESPSQSLLQVGRLLVPRRFRSSLVERLVLLNQKHASRPPMDPALRQELLHEFWPEIELLSSLINRDLTVWGNGVKQNLPLVSNCK